MESHGTHSYLTKALYRKPLCRLKREIKEGRDFSLASRRLQGEVTAQCLPPHSSREVQATGGSTNTGFSLWICTGYQLSRNELNSISYHVFLQHN